MVYNDIHICQVKGVHENYVYIRKPNGSIYHAHETNIHSIPLTEEWLLKFGFNFVKSTHDEAECYDYFYNLLYLNMANHSISINGKCVLSFIPDYIHQLQNLYFALTGEELTIKQS